MHGDLLVVVVTHAARDAVRLALDNGDARNLGERAQAARATDALRCFGLEPEAGAFDEVWGLEVGREPLGKRLELASARDIELRAHLVEVREDTVRLDLVLEPDPFVGRAYRKRGREHSSEIPGVAATPGHRREF